MEDLLCHLLKVSHLHLMREKCIKHYRYFVPDQIVVMVKLHQICGLQDEMVNT